MKKITKNSAETKNFAADLAEKILKKKIGRHAKVVALKGNLGSGKTTFVQGFGKALGIQRRIISPTFILFRRYNNFYHFDLYRIHSLKDILALGFKGVISNPKNIILIEWPEKIKKFLPKDTIWVEFKHGKRENERIITYRRTRADS